MKNIRFILLSAALLIVAASAGAVASASRPAVNVAATDVWRFSNDQTVLEAAANARSESVVFVRLPAGDWVLSLTATAVDLGGSDVVRCGLFKDNHQLNMAGTSVSKNANVAAMITTTAVVHSTTSFAADIKCQHDRPASGQLPYIDPGATLVAHRATNYQ